MDKVKILIVLTGLTDNDGVSNFVKTIFELINHQVFQIDFATYKEIDSNAEIIKIIRSMNLKTNIYNLSTFNNIFHITKLKQIISNYDIIHINLLSRALPLMMVARYLNKKVILHSHSAVIGVSFISKLRNILCLPLLKKCTTSFAACSKGAGNLLFPENKFKVINNSIKSALFKFDNIRRKKMRAFHAINDTTFVIGIVARIYNIKNPFFCIDIIKEILKKYNNVEFWWIGDGPMKNELQQYIKDNKMEQKVKLFGTRADTIDFYCAFDLFLLPSQSEGLGISVIEAQATGLPCIVSTGVPCIVDYSHLVQFLSLDIPAKYWADCIINIMNNPSVRRSYEKELVESPFYDIGNVRELEKYYLEIAK